MILTFGVVKNERGFQAECLEAPQIVACGWTWDQLLETLRDHTLAFLPELDGINAQAQTDAAGTDVFCGYIKVEIDTVARDLRIVEQKRCETA